jgi:hypothetical protein
MYQGKQMPELTKSDESRSVERFEVAPARKVKVGPSQTAPITKLHFLEYAEHAALWTQQDLLDEVCAVLWGHGMLNVAESDYENILTVSENDFVWELFIKAHNTSESGMVIIFTAVSDQWCTSAKRVDLVTDRIAQAAVLTHATLPVNVAIDPVPTW